MGVVITPTAYATLSPWSVVLHALHVPRTFVSTALGACHAACRPCQWMAQDANLTLQLERLSACGAQAFTPPSRSGDSVDSCLAQAQSGFGESPVTSMAL